jgi:hypothetical protein
MRPPGRSAHLQTCTASEGTRAPCSATRSCHSGTAGMGPVVSAPSSINRRRRDRQRQRQPRQSSWVLHAAAESSLNRRRPRHARRDGGDDRAAGDSEFGMTTATNVFNVAAAIIASVGGAGVILLALAGWLGKVWAARILEEDRAKYQSELERLKGELEARNEALQGEIDKTIHVHRLHFAAASAPSEFTRYASGRVWRFECTVQQAASGLNERDGRNWGSGTSTVKAVESSYTTHESITASPRRPARSRRSSPHRPRVSSRSDRACQPGAARRQCPPEPSPRV